MTRFSIGAIAAVLAATLGLTTFASAATTQGNIGPYASVSHDKSVAQAMGAPPADFGSPPSGEVPILFNDHHVYSKPDTLKQGRLLAALVRGGTVLVPLRSLFEQTGATVSYDPASKTVDVSKPGSDVKVTVGDPTVVINGESRPLDVPPEIYHGAVLVPVRVIAEGMGAYVAWVPDKHVVVVRYVPAPEATPMPPPPPATMAPTMAPTKAPTPTPAPAATVSYEKFIAGDYIFSPKVYNEFSPGNTGKSSYAAHGAAEFPLFGLPWMIAGDYEQWSYPHNCTDPTLPTADCQTNVIGTPGAVTVPSFTVKEYDGDGRLGFKVADPRIYIGVGWLFHSGNYGYPKLNGLEFGAEKLPDLDQPFSVYGSAYYAPQVKGSFQDPSGNVFELEYRELKYQVGGTFDFGKSPIFLDFGYLGDRLTNKQNAPSDETHNGPYAGLGIHF
ncbi:MAG TPA: copper amine oxidase N-terminal domain-containing protein [Candidatus Baltobacteraceae bacterium]